MENVVHLSVEDAANIYDDSNPGESFVVTSRFRFAFDVESSEMSVRPFRILENAETLGAEACHLSARWKRGEMTQPAYCDAMKKMRWREVVRAAKRLRNRGAVCVDVLRLAAEIHIRFEGGHSYQRPHARRDVEILTERGCLSVVTKKGKSSKVSKTYEYIRDFDESTDWIEEVDSHFAALRRCGARARHKDRENQKRLKFLQRLTKEKGTMTIDYDYE